MMELPNYSSQLMQQLWALRNGEHFCDCTVLVGESPHRAHKLLLAAASQLFRSLLATSDVISIDTAVVSSQEFICLLDMVYTGKLPVGKHNVSRIIAAADNLQMFDVAIGLKKVLTTIVNTQPSLSENAAQSQDEIENNRTDSSTTPIQQPPLQKNDFIRETKSPNAHFPSIKRQRKEHHTSDSDYTEEPSHKRTDQRVASAGPQETVKENTEIEAASNEQSNVEVLEVLKHSSVIIELLNKLPAVRDLLRQAAEHCLDQQDRQVVITCCDIGESCNIGEMLLSHVKKGVLSEKAFIGLLRTVHKNNPTKSTQLQSVLQELDPETTGPHQLKDSTQEISEADETKEVEDTKEDCVEEEEEEENRVTDDSDDSVFKKEPSSSPSRKHTCRSCKKTFAYKCRLRVHVKRCSRSKRKTLDQSPEKSSNNGAQTQAHKSKKKVECEICNRKFAHPSGLLYHIRSEHLDEKPFTCKECGAKFAAKSSLKNHVRLHTGEKPYTCSECDMTFPVAAGLAYHVKKKHSQGNMYVCQYCKAEFPQSIELTRHVRTHTGDRPYVCRECGKGYSQASQLTAHLESAHATGETYDCQKCALSFASQVEHNQHIQEVHPDEFYKCPACEKVFPNVTLLNKHKSTHTGVKLFNCDLCNKSYQQLSGLWYHNRTQHAEVFSCHTRQLKALVQCNICFKFFPSEETLAQHQAIEHQGSSGSSFRCPLCPAVFAGRDWMQEHITTHHAEQRESVCIRCFVECGSAQELQDHMRAHHPETQEEQEQETSAMEAPRETVNDIEQVMVAECHVQAEPSHAADFVLRESQSHLENAQQVFVALADGKEGAQVVEMSMFDLLNNSVTFICEESAPSTSTQT